MKPLVFLVYFVFYIVEKGIEAGCNEYVLLFEDDSCSKNATAAKIYCNDNCEVDMLEDKESYKAFIEDPNGVLSGTMFCEDKAVNECDLGTSIITWGENNTYAAIEGITPTNSTNNRAEFSDTSSKSILTNDTSQEIEPINATNNALDINNATDEGIEFTNATTTIEDATNFTNNHTELTTEKGKEIINATKDIELTNYTTEVIEATNATIGGSEITNSTNKSVELPYGTDNTTEVMNVTNEIEVNNATSQGTGWTNVTSGGIDLNNATSKIECANATSKEQFTSKDEGISTKTAIWIAVGAVLAGISFAFIIWMSRKLCLGKEYIVNNP